MNDMTPLPRHKQRAVTFRSDKAVALLARLTRDGKSQAEAIEEALQRAVDESTPLTLEEKIARIDAIVRPWHGIKGKNQAEMDEEMYDEFGLPR